MEAKHISKQHDQANTVMALDKEEPQPLTMTRSVEHEPLQEEKHDLFHSANKPGKSRCLPSSIPFDD